MESLSFTDMRQIQNENIIMLVERRPVLWDRTLQAFKNPHLKRKVWEEISRNLYENFEEMDEVGQKEFVDAVMLRWACLKKRFITLRKELDQSESGCGLEKYAHTDQLQFLEKVYEKPSNTSTSLLGDQLPTNGPFLEPSTENTRKRTRKRFPSDEKESKKLKTHQESEFSSSLDFFFQSIVPQLNKFNISEFLEFQEGFLQVVANIYEKRKHYQPLDFYL